MFQEKFSVAPRLSPGHCAPMESWHHRLTRSLNRRGWSAAELSRRSGVSEQNIYKYLQGKVDQPRGKALPVIAAALGVHALWLRDGVGPELASIPLEGYIGAGESFIPATDATIGEASIDFSADDPIAVEVRGTSMLPVYRPGDYLLCARTKSNFSEHCLNRDCIVLTADGFGYIKRLIQGSAPDRFTLLSYNGAPIENVELSWCAPVVWVRRNGL